jgi:DNA-nicking Smr family endonuclease
MKKQFILDLHQKTKIESEKELEDFFILANEKKVKKVQIITGWGSNSNSGKPILYNYVGFWLKEKGYDFEGDYGAYIVNLDGEVRKNISF